MEAYQLYLNEQGLAPTTVKNHIRNMTNYSYPLDASEEDTLGFLEQYKEGSPRKTIAAAVSKYRTYKGYPNELIRAFLKGSVENALALNKKNTETMTLPTWEELNETQDSYFEKSKYKEFVVMYLLLNLNVRNLDLVARVTYETPEETGNYLIVSNGFVLYLRNNYKTFKTYGQLSNVIKDKRFLYAVGLIDSLLTETQLLHIQVKKITKGWTETQVMKVAVKHASSIGQMDTLSKNRGTSLPVMAQSYNVEGFVDK